jgi:HAD superfamily hydrolase (TIGR01509 family)
MRLQISHGVESMPQGSSIAAQVELVIFDCDGVLIDSEPIANQVLCQQLQELGLDLTLDQVLEQFLGRSMQQCLLTITHLLGRPPPASFAEDYRRRTTAAFATQLRPVPGIEAALDRLQMPYCLASSSDHTRIRTSLNIVGLLPRFEGRLFSVTEVARGKPAPDVFLHAARTLGVPACRCLVIEDTPTGVAAGVAANMQVFGYAALTPGARLITAGAHRTFSDMSELPRLIGAAGDGCDRGREAWS